MIKNLELIAAIGANNELGYKNQLIWKIKEDLDQFKKITMGKNMIMGYNTYDSMPKNLKGRNYIVLTRKNIELQNVKIYHSKESLIENLDEQEKYIVVGGAQIYKLFIDDVYIMYLTHIYDNFKDADTYFPSFDEKLYEKSLMIYGSTLNRDYKQYKYTRR